MIGALSVMTETPCLIELLTDDGPPNLTVIEPLLFVPVSLVYSIGRINGFGLKGENSVHADLTTQTGGQHHVAQ